MSDIYKLLDVCDFQGGTQPPKDEWRKEPLDGYVRMLQIRDYSQDAEKYAEYVKDTKKLHKCKVEDIMLSRYGYIGQAFMGLEGAYNVALVKVIKLREIETKYLLYYFKSKSFQHYLLENVGARATIPGFNKSELKDATIRIPSTNEQLYIAGVLGKIEGIIEIRQQELKKLDNLIKARFVEMFGDLRTNTKGWNIKTFDELSDLITDGEHATPRRTSEGIYLLSARNVLNHSLQLEDVDYIDQEEYDRIAKRVIPREGDVLISCSGTVGRCCRVPAGLKFQMVRSAALIRFKDEINPVFAEYMITSDYLQEQINSSKTASSQANLFQGKIKALKGVVPPIELQNEFLTYVKQVDKSKVAVQKALDETQLLFDSLMQEYFG